MKWLIRGSITLIWLTLFILTLYAPKWNRFLPDDNTLYVFTWGGLIDTDVVQRFEQKSGYKVHLSYYESNEELLIKLRSTKGKGCDLILPSDYAVRALIQEGLLKEIDTKQLRNFRRIDPALLHHPFDPENRFSLPFAWELFGFGIKKEVLERKGFVPSLHHFFAPESLKIAMTNDPLEAICLASLSLFGKVETLTDSQIQQVKALFSKQKAYVEAYNNYRPDQLLTSNQCSLIYSAGSYVLRAMKEFPDIDFVLPTEGTYVSIENFCIPKTTKKEALAYQFIDALYEPESVKAHWNSYMLYPTTIDALEYMDCDAKTRAIFSSAKEGFKKWQFFHNLLPEEQQRKLWIEARVE